MKKSLLIILAIFTLNNINAQENSSGDKEIFFKNGLFIDGFAGIHKLFGSGFSNTSIGFGLRVGSKWYLKEGKVGAIAYSMGPQVTWLRIGIYIKSSGNSLQTVPLMPGFTSIWKVNEKIIVEGNMNIPLLSTDHNLEAEDGIFVLFLNPEIKMRYKKLSAGFDIVQSFYTMDGDNDNAKTSLFVFSITAGIKF